MITHLNQRWHLWNQKFDYLHHKITPFKRIYNHFSLVHVVTAYVSNSVELSLS